MPIASADTSTAASLDAVSVDFEGHTALHEVSLGIDAAALTVIAGPNGAGKSTLLEVLAGALAPSSGRVTVTARSRAFVPQRAAIPDRLPVTARDVVTTGAWGRVGPWRRLDAAARRAVDDAIARVGLDGLDRAPFHALSGGQRQRALLAHGLARSADLLLLDEPTTGLDAESRQRIREAIDGEVARGAAVVCVSHDDELITAGDRVVRLEAGRVIPAT